MATTHDDDTLEALLEDARDWGHYADCHPDTWQATEWAQRIARKLADLADA